MKRLLVVLIALALPGCTRSPSKTGPEHPASLVGRWVRLREDQTWGDTLVYLPTGQVLGSTGHQVPDSARWWVETRATGRLFCAADAEQGYCQSFHLVGDELLLTTPAGATTFRRVAG
jgi:hypothetical protein